MVELRRIVEALEADPRSRAYFYDRERDCIVEGTTGVFDSEDRHVLDDEEPIDSSRYILIERDEYFEYEVMNAFIDTVDDPVLVSKLEAAANRHGAEKHFRNTVLGARLEKEWFEFRGERYRNEARHMCEAYGIPFS